MKKVELIKRVNYSKKVDIYIDNMRTISGRSYGICISVKKDTWKERFILKRFSEVIRDTKPWFDPAEVALYMEIEDGDAQELFELSKISAMYWRKFKDAYYGDRDDVDVLLCVSSLKNLEE